jgi:serine/threonine-protein kinase
VLYEMLTGRRAFDGDDISTTLAVIRTEPEWSALPVAAPPSLRRLLIRCLQKDPRERLRDIGEARIAVDHLASGAVEDSMPAPTVRRSPRWRRVAIPVATAVGASLATTVWFASWSTVVRPAVSRMYITSPTTAALSIDGMSRDIAITPDDSRVIYVGANGTMLFVRPLDQLDATPLVRGGAPRDPFVAPDGQWVGFFDGPGTLKKVAITGGPAALVAQGGSLEQGATWTADGTIIFATTSSGLQRVNADGGVPTVLTRPDRARGEAGHVWPELLPGGQAVLCTVMATTGGLDAASIGVLDLRSGRLTILLRGGSHAQYVPSGHLVYAAAGTLRAVGFDLTRLSVVGPARPVVPQVLTTSGGCRRGGAGARWDARVCYRGCGERTGEHSRVGRSPGR